MKSSMIKVIIKDFAQVLLRKRPTSRTMIDLYDYT